MAARYHQMLDAVAKLKLAEAQLIDLGLEVKNLRASKDEAVASTRLETTQVTKR